MFHVLLNNRGVERTCSPTTVYNSGVGRGGGGGGLIAHEKWRFVRGPVNLVI